MTTELEQEFFSVFGIKQEYQYHVRDMGRSYVGNKQMLIDNKHLFMDKERKRSRRLYVANVSKIYPDITAEKLLEMICILNETACEVLAAENIEDLKNEILETCIKVYNTPILTSDGDEYDNYAIYDKIQQLFNEDNQ